MTLILIGRYTNEEAVLEERNQKEMRDGYESEYREELWNIWGLKAS